MNTKRIQFILFVIAMNAITLGLAAWLLRPHAGPPSVAYAPPHAGMAAVPFPAPTGPALVLTSGEAGQQPSWQQPTAIGIPGVDPTGTIDSAAAINAAEVAGCASAPDAGVSQNQGDGPQLRLAAGLYKLTSSIHLICSTLLMGTQGGTQSPSTWLLPAAGVTAIVVDAPFTNGSNATSGASSVIEALGIAQTSATRNVYTTWAATHLYHTSDKVRPDFGSQWQSAHAYNTLNTALRPDVENGLSYLVSTTGTSAVTPPFDWTANSGSPIGNTVSDNSAVYTAALYDDPEFYYVPTGTGTSGSTPPTWSNAQGPTDAINGTTVSDGSVTWVTHEVANGIRMHARATVRDVSIYGLEGHGISILASTGSTPTTNANEWRIENVRADGNLGSGLYVRGSDANAGLSAHLLATTNAWNGVTELSSLGNTYVQNQFAYNTLSPAITFGQTNASAFYNCYTESGQQDALIQTPASWNNGEGALNFRYTSFTGLITTANTYVSTSPLYQAGARNSDAGLALAQMVVTESNTTAFYRWNLAHAGNFERLLDYNGVDTYPEWVLDYGRLAAYQGWQISGENNLETPAMFKAPRGIFLGPDVTANVNSGPRLSSMAQVPDAGAEQFRVGDPRLNTNPYPTANGTAGILEWVANTRGSFNGGTWPTATAVVAGSMVAANGIEYRATNTCTTGGSNPTGGWSTSIGARTALDGTCIWEAFGAQTVTFTPVFMNGGLTELTVDGGTSTIVPVGSIIEVNGLAPSATTINLYVSIGEILLLFDGTTGVGTTTFQPVGGTGLAPGHGKRQVVYVDSTYTFQPVTAPN